MISAWFVFLQKEYTDYWIPETSRYSAYHPILGRMRDLKEKREAWSVDKASELYHINRCGANYFGINEEGHATAYPLQDAGGSVDIMDIVEEVKSRGLKFPILIRFQDILKHRVASINQSFQRAIKECDYKNTYRGVFPIKVNQLKEVVEEIMEGGKPFGMGL